MPTRGDAGLSATGHDASGAAVTTRRGIGLVRALATIAVAVCAMAFASSAAAADPSETFLDEWSFSVTVVSESTVNDPSRPYSLHTRNEATYVGGAPAKGAMTWTGNLDDTEASPFPNCAGKGYHAYGKGSGTGTFSTGTGGFDPASFGVSPANAQLAFVPSTNDVTALTTDVKGCAGTVEYTFAGPQSPPIAPLFLPGLSALNALADGGKVVRGSYSRTQGFNVLSVDYVATRIEKPVTLTVKVNGRGRVIGGVECRSRRIRPDVFTKTCTKTFRPGSIAALAKLPGNGQDVSSWQGCDTVVGNQCRVRMDRDRTVMARFAKKDKTFLDVGYGLRGVTCVKAPQGTARLEIKVRLTVKNSDNSGLDDHGWANKMTVSARLETGDLLQLPRPWVHQSSESLIPGKTYTRDFTLITDNVDPQKGPWRVHLKYEWARPAYKDVVVDLKSFTDVFDNAACEAALR